MPAVRLAGLRWQDGATTLWERDVATEVAIAFSYNRNAHAVMMATPADLKDFAVGFSLAEGIIATADEIEELEIVEVALGIELRMWIAPARIGILMQRRRRLTGPTGCGLCGLEALSEAVMQPPVVTGEIIIAAENLLSAMAEIEPAQILNHQTHAVHAAAFWDPAEGLVALREDVGRHNALDKLAGALARSGRSTETGAVLLTSRVSVELVQKTAQMGAPILLAVSAPTSMAIDSAERAGITLAAVARSDGFEIFTHPRRITV